MRRQRVAPQSLQIVAVQEGARALTGQPAELQTKQSAKGETGLAAGARLVIPQFRPTGLLAGWPRARGIPARPSTQPSQLLRACKSLRGLLVVVVVVVVVVVPRAAPLWRVELARAAAASQPADHWILLCAAWLCWAQSGAGPSFRFSCKLEAF